MPKSSRKPLLNRGDDALFCPHCQQKSILADGVESTSGFIIICGHCEEPFSAIDKPDTQKIDPFWAIACPDCERIMRLSKSDYQQLLDHHIHCPYCHICLLLPETMPEASELISFAPPFRPYLIASQIALLYVIIICSLALLFTPEGTAFISHLSQHFDMPQAYLLGFHHTVMEQLTAFWADLQMLYESARDQLLLWTSERL